MRLRVHLVTLAGLLALVAPSFVSAAGPQTPAASTTSSTAPSDPLVGIWVLNLSKSKFEGVTPPKAERRYLESHANGILNVTETTSATGTRSVSHYITAFNDKPDPEYSRQGGSKVIATLWFNRPDRHTIKIRGKNDQPNGDFTGTWNIASDGKTLTIQLIGKDAEGKPTNRIRVYDREF